MDVGGSHVQTSLFENRPGLSIKKKRRDCFPFPSPHNISILPPSPFSHSFGLSFFHSFPSCSFSFFCIFLMSKIYFPPEPTRQVLKVSLNDLGFDFFDAFLLPFCSSSERKKLVWNLTCLNGQVISPGFFSFVFLSFFHSFFLGFSFLSFFFLFSSRSLFSLQLFLSFFIRCPKFKCLILTHRLSMQRCC